MPLRLFQRAFVLGLVLAALLSFGAGEANAANVTWKSSSNTGVWNTGANWSSGSVPTTSDAVFFNTGSVNCQIDTTAAVGSLTIASSYTGTISQSGTRTLFIDGNYTQSAATVSAIDKIFVEGNFSITAGTFNAPTTLAVNGTFSTSGSPTLSFTGSTVILNSSNANQSYSLSSYTFNNLYFSDGLVGYWKLDETSGTTAADSSGYGLTLTHRNTPTISATVATTLHPNVQSLSFDEASSEYLDDNVSTTAVPYHLRTDQWTYTAWVKVTDLDSGGAGGAPECSDGDASEVLSLGNNNGLRICATAAAPTAGKLRLHMKTASSYSSCGSSNTITINDGNWHHLVATNNGTDLVVYLDNTKTTCAGDGTGQAYTVAKAFTIGRTGAGANYHWDGLIDEVRIYRRALGDTEVAQLYHGTNPEGAYTLTASTAITANGNIGILSGVLASSSAIGGGGSWLNYGGRYTGTGTVTLSAISGSLELLTNYQPFAALVLTGASGGATWTLGDRLDVDGTLSLTRGTLSAGSNTIYAGTITQGANGTFTAGTSTVVIDASSTQTLTVSSAMNNLRVEDATETSLVGYWKFDRMLGPTEPDASGSGATGTLANGTYWTTSVPTSSPGPIVLENPGSIYLDGVDDDVAFTAPTTTSITVAGWIYLVSNGTNGGSFPRIVDIPNTRFSIRVADSYLFAFEANHSGTTGIWKSTAPDVVGLGAWYHFAVTYDGSSTSNVPVFYVNGTANATATTTTAPVGTRTTTGGASYIGGNAAANRMINAYIDDLRIYNTPLTATQIKNLYAGRHANTGGATTVTLGADTTVNGALYVDSGTLATSSYALSAAASDATKVAYVNANGGLTIGSNTANFYGGLTTRYGTTVTMNTGSGALKFGNNKTFTMDGTLDVSTADLTRNIACTSASGCFYAFTVGSSSTATPTLNIDGLTISQLDSSGLNVNSVAGSSTTFTKFDNVTFSGGTGTYQMQIQAAALTLYANGMSFDNTSKTKNLKLSDTSGAGNDVRVYIGGTCSPTTDCESMDEDDDTKLVDGSTNGSDGTPDDAGNDGSVVQWLHRSWTDTAGTPVGFPTQAFDWNTFAALKTYALFNNYDGSQGRLYARDTDGKASGAMYYWTSSTANENYLGAPRFTQEGSSYYLWVISTTGRVYKIQDTGAALTTVAGYPFRDGAMATATSPLWLDSSNVYWAGKNGSGSRKMFNLPQTSTTLNGSTADVTSDISVVPAVQVTGGTTYLYGAISGTVYRSPSSGGAATTVSVTDSGVSGRMSLFSNIVYFMENDGTVWALNSSDLSTNWSYQDTDAGRHPGGCTSANQCSSGGLFLQALTGRVTYGDKDGHIYVVTKNGSSGTLLSGFPIQPGASTDIITTPPLVSNGIIAAGTSGGKVFLIDQQNASSAPALIRTYNFRSAISTISYDRNSSVSGEYMITTADGRLFYVSRITDPTPSND